MDQGRHRRNREASKVVALDPLAMTLAICLGVIVSVAALGRLEQEAEAQANFRSDPVKSLTQLGQSPQFAAVGG